MKYRTKDSPQVDLLNGPIFSSLIRFAIPMFLSSLFQQLYNTMDTVIVGHTLGDTSLAAIGAATPAHDLLIGFALGMGNGLAMVTARSFGRRDGELLKRSVASALVIGAGITLVIVLGSRIGLMPFLKLLNTPEQIIEEAYSYISVITLFTGVMLAYNLCSGILRAIGNSFIPLLFLIISSILNVVLDLVFITRFHMGIQGAAAATVVAQGVSVVLCVIYIGKRAAILVPQPQHFKAGKILYKEMMTQGLSLGLMNCLVSAGSAVLQSGINGLGYLVIAGHTAARKLSQFCMMPYFGLFSAVNTFVAQNYGADQPERIRKAVKTAYQYAAMVTILIMAVLFAFAPAMVQMISGSSEGVVLQNGALYLRVVAPFYFVLGLVSVTRMSLQAIGQKVLPIMSSIIELFGKIIFTMIFIPRFGYMAVIFCEPIIWCFMAAELLLAFWRNPYMKQKT